MGVQGNRVQLSDGWDVTVFTKNRERLVQGDIARAFFQAVLAAPEVQPLLSLSCTRFAWTPICVGKPES